MPSPILLCTDGSDQSMEALSLGLDLLGHSNELVLVTVASGPDPASLVGSGHAGPDMHPRGVRRIGRTSQPKCGFCDSSSPKGTRHRWCPDSCAAGRPWCGHLPTSDRTVGSGHCGWHSWPRWTETGVPWFRLRSRRAQCTLFRDRDQGRGSPLKGKIALRWRSMPLGIMSTSDR